MANAEATEDPTALKLPDRRNAVSDAANNDATNPVPDQHPQGIKLLLIALALILSIFFSALDSTSSRPSSPNNLQIQISRPSRLVR